MKLSTTFTRGVITATPTATLKFVVQLMHSHNVGAVVIVENGRLASIATESVANSVTSLIASATKSM